MKQLSSRTARPVEVSGARERHARALRVALLTGAGALALLAFVPAASQAQTPPAPADAATAPMAPTPGTTGAPGTPGTPPLPVPSAVPPAAAPSPPLASPAPPSPPLTTPPPPPPRDAMVQRKAGSVTYICGGVADDEQRALSAQARNYNMGLLFTQGARGEYLSDVNVKLIRNGREVANFVADGPKCLLRAPEGSYSVRATYEGRTKTQVVSTGTRNAQMRW
ncbi:hypothetical protein LMG23994_02282 [Cupriavidus pinatubonensis]|uniref:Uncharacterized protein n=1 Tax=Cupriavidus pinatubonensis TaxID=248026 RepID=A0ABN7YEW3_9BURK|nr:hypothetical protein [Cupriavidus pinatubonensis]CAG9171954.1 hypothetical protein LMG23994_02282 [Cupriavidus pinatubonensis]